MKFSGLFKRERIAAEREWKIIASWLPLEEELTDAEAISLLMTHGQRHDINPNTPKVEMKTHADGLVGQYITYPWATEASTASRLLLGLIVQGHITPARMGRPPAFRTGSCAESIPPRSQRHPSA